MNQMDCGVVRERLAEVASGAARFESVSAHLSQCAPCRDEWALVEALRRGRPRPSPGFEGRLLRRLRLERGSAGRSWWGLTAAAVAALALGIGLTSDRTADLASPAFAVELEEGWPLRSDEGLIAGAPIFDDLSDDELSDLFVVLAQDLGR